MQYFPKKDLWVITNFWILKFVVFEVIEKSFEIERTDKTKEH